MMKNALKRLIALILALAICLSLLSANVWAAESSGADLAEESNDISEAEQSVPLGEEPAPEAEASAVPEAEAETEEQSAKPEMDKQKGQEPKSEGVKTQAIVASGECGAQGDNLTWTLDSDGTLTISGSGAMENYINAPWAWSGIIKKLIIQDGVTSIGEYALYKCSSLTSVTIPDSVTNIGKMAFYNCTSLPSIIIPDKVTDIGASAFSWCVSLSSIDIPDGITNIEYGVFCNCSSLTSVTIPSGVTSIGGSAFSGCSSLTSVSISDSVTTIEGDAFSDCRNLTSVSIPDSVTNIGTHAFYRCNSLTSAIIGNGVTSIDEYVFGYCGSLTSVTIPDRLISIGDGAFSDCDSLTSVTIPDSVTKIGRGAFIRCSSLIEVAIPNSVTTIDSAAFSCCTSLTKVELSNSLTIIEADVFTGCSNLTSIIIPGSVKNIQGSAFSVCTSLKKIYFEGDAPGFASSSFDRVTATAYYPANNSTWTDKSKQNYGGTITWVEWNPKEETNIRYALTPDQVWGFNMRGLGKLKLKHYYKFFPIPCFSEWLLEQDDGGNGFCAGFVTSAIAASGYDSPPAYSFVKNGSRVTKLNEIKSNDFISEVNGMSAADFIKYAYVYQNTPLTILEKNIHANDIKKLYSAIVKSINQNGEYVEIHMRGPYEGENEGHVVLAMGIAQDNENTATVKVYDGNFPDELKELRLFKNTNGWSYNVSGFLNWGDDKEGAFISYTTSGKDFARDLFTYPSSIDLIAYNSMMSVKSKDAKVSINNAKSIDLNNNGDDDVLEMNTSKITLGNNNPVNNNTLYWLKNANDIAVYNGSNSNTVSIASTKGAVSVSFPEQSTLTIINSSGEENASISNLKKDAKVIIEFIHYSDETSSKLIIDGTATGSVTAVENEDKTISISGITYADVKKVVNDDTVDETSIESDGRTIGLSVDGEDIVQLDPILEQPEPSPSPAPKPEKQKNTITAKNIVKSYSIKKQTVKLNAKTKGGSKLSYKLNNKKVKVDRNGKATLPAKFSGTVKITITAAATNKYNQATKTITVTVPTATNVKKATAGKGQMTVQWKKNATGRGYEIQYSTDKKFKKGAKIAKINKNTTLKAIIKKLKKGTWYVRIRTVNGKAYSDWSKAKSLKVTK